MREYTSLSRYNTETLLYLRARVAKLLSPLRVIAGSAALAGIRIYLKWGSARFTSIYCG